MGLDMYAMTTWKKVRNEVDFEIDEDDCETLHTWRKHPNLHGMMHCLYIWKGGEKTNFNCVNVKLTEDDLREIEELVMNGTLPETAGFFFGESDGSEQADDLIFIEKARTALKSGLTVYYRAWW